MRCCAWAFVLLATRQNALHGLSHGCSFLLRLISECRFFLLGDDGGAPDSLGSARLPE